MNNLTSSKVTKYPALCYPRACKAIASTILAICMSLCSSQAIAQAINFKVPSDASFLFALPTPQQNSAAFQLSPLGKLLYTPPWVQYTQTLKARDQFSGLNIQPFFGLGWSDIEKLNAPTLFFGRASSANDFALLLAIDSQQSTQQVLPLVRQYFATQKYTSKEEMIHSTRVIAFASATGKGINQENFLAITKEQCGLFTSRETLQTWLGAKTPISIAPYVLDPRTAKPNSICLIEFAPIQLAKMLLSNRASEPKPKRDPLAALSRQGLASLTKVNIEIRYEEKSNATLIPWQIQHESLEMGMRILAFKSSTAVMPSSWIRTDAVQWSVSQRDVPQWFEGLGAWFDERADPEVPGAFRDVLDALETDPEGPQIRVREQIVSRFVGSMQAASFESTSAKQPTSQNTIIAIAVKESPELIKVFTRYFANDDVIEQGKIGDAPYWRTKNNEPIFMETGESNEQVPTSIAVLPSEVLLAANWSELEAVLKNRSPQNPLSQSPRFALIQGELARLGVSNKAGTSAVRFSNFLGGAYKELQTFQRVQKTNQAKEERSFTSLSAEALGWILIGPQWRSNPELSKSLPDLDQDWMNSLGDCATGFDVGANTISGSTIVLPAK